MKKIIFPMAGIISNEIEPVTIEISAEMPKLEHLKETNLFFEHQGELLADILLDTLPQGIIEPLIIKLMQRKISLYYGRMIL